MQSNILVWSQNSGFIQINEGSGDNLSREDIENGYVDYIMITMISYDGYNFNETDGAQVMLTELYQEKFKEVDEVVAYLIDTGFIPEDAYMFLYIS